MNCWIDTTSCLMMNWPCWLDCSKLIARNWLQWVGHPKLCHSRKRRFFFQLWRRWGEMGWPIQEDFKSPGFRRTNHITERRASNYFKHSHKKGGKWGCLAQYFYLKCLLTLSLNPKKRHSQEFLSCSYFERWKLEVKYVGSLNVNHTDIPSNSQRQEKLEGITSSFLEKKTLWKRKTILALGYLCQKYSSRS